MLLQLVHGWSQLRAAPAHSSRRQAVSLSSLKEAVPFYKRLGFKIIPAGDMADTLLPGEELIEDQARLHWAWSASASDRRAGRRYSGFA